MGGEQSRQKRTIAASRSDDNRDEPRNRDNEKKARFSAANEPEEFAPSPGAPVTEPPGGKPFPLDKLFQERSDTPRQVFDRCSPGATARCHRHLLPIFFCTYPTAAESRDVLQRYTRLGFVGYRSRERKQPGRIPYPVCGRG